MEEPEILRADNLMRPEDEIAVLHTRMSVSLPHSHDFVEFAYVDAGRGYHIIDGQRDTIQKGNFFIINTQVPHEYASEPGAEIVMYNCIFRPDCLGLSLGEEDDFVNVAYRYLLHSFYADKAPRQYIKFTGGKSRKINRLLEDMYEEYAARDNGYKQVLHSDLVKLLILAFRMYKNDEGQVQNPPMLKRLTVENALQYMQTHYTREITCESLAARAYMSVSRFNKTFKEETGQTVLHALQDIRIKEACRLLRLTSLPVAQVALQVGYADLKHFYKLFSQFTGSTPGAYRKNPPK